MRSRIHLGRAFGETLTGGCAPAIDVYETDEALEIKVDLPGRGDVTFHLVERGYGRFARTVRLTVPCDTGNAHATLANGELRMTLRKIAERRGHPIQVPVRIPSN